MGARLKFWRRSRVPKEGSRDEAVEIPYFSRLRRQISLDYYTISPATQASHARAFHMVSLKFRKSYGLYPFHDALQVPTLLGVVASVCTPLSTVTQQLPTLSGR